MSAVHKFFRHLRGPRCHVTADQKKWVEARFLWLEKQFGPRPVVRPPLDPTSTLLPRKWSRSPEAAEDLLTRLCEFMLVDRNRLQLELYRDRMPENQLSPFVGTTQHSGAAGLFCKPDDSQRLIIGLAEAELNQPARLAATICHELGHVHLLADRRIPRDAPDSEPLTDLLTVFFGAGIFTANSAFEFTQWQSHSHQGWSTSRLGYLSEEIFGYALASYAWYRGELKPVWARHLRSNIAYYFDDSLHFLSSTRESTIPFGRAEPERGA